MEKLRIQDDLFNYVNHDWLKKAKIPSDKPCTGGFVNLADDVEKILINDFTTMIETNTYPNDYLKEAANLFKLVLNTSRRKRNGIKPALKVLDKINSLKDVDDFNNNLKDFVELGITLPFVISVDADMKDTKHHAVNLQGPSCILPDTTYYNKENEQTKQALLQMWSSMVKSLLAYTNLSKDEQEKYLEDAIAYDAIIASLVKSSEEWSEYVKSYNPMKTSSVCQALKPIKFKNLLNNLFNAVPEKIIIAEPRWLKGFKTLFNKENFELYKHWAYVNELINATSFLSEELRNLGGSYRRSLSGIAKMTNVKKYAYQLTGSLFSEPVGLYYGKTYFGEEAKKDIVEMVYEIINTYKDRVAKSTILEPSTKEKAILKLSTMKVKMGYPDSVDPFYDTLKVNPRLSLYENVCELGKAIRVHEFAKLHQEYDRSKWVMPGHMVNACYNPFSNDITFPAAILQAPFYSIKQTRSQNLGGIGAVIGHEISHAFDNNGAKCDENGNLNNWWTKEDNRKFKARTKAMVKQFDGIELPWGKVNGSFIVSENIADNGGMAATLQIMKSMENANYEQYFTQWAKIWCMKGKEEYLKLLLAIDVHGPAILRTNMPPRNFEEWYKTFNVTNKDKMYIKENKRVVIW